jgi:hypothetical protein
MEVCYKLIRGDVARDIAPTIESTSSFGLEPELTAKLSKYRRNGKHLKFRICPVSYHPRSKEEGKHLNAFRDGIKALGEIFRYNIGFGIESLFYILMGILAFIITLDIAVNARVIYDEAFSYLNYVKDFKLKSVIYSDPPFANNHVINSIAMTFMTLFKPVSSFSLRLPNLIAHIIYIIFSFKITRHIKDSLISVTTFSLLIFSPLLLEYFSRARGYGIALSLMIVSVYYLLRNKGYDRLNYTVALIAAGLATYSVLSFLNFFIGVFIAIVWLSYKKEKLGLDKIRSNKVSLLGVIKRFSKTNITYLFVFLSIISIVAVSVFIIRGANTPVFGGTSLIQDTIIATFRRNFFIFEYTVIYIFLIFGIFMLVSFYLTVLKQFKTAPIVISILLLSSLILPIFQNILGIPYPKERTSMMIIPLSFLFIGVWAQIPTRKVQYLQKLIKINLGLLSLLSIVNLYFFYKRISNEFVNPYFSILESIEDTRKSKDLIHIRATWYPYTFLEYYNEIGGYEDEIKVSRISMGLDCDLIESADYYLFYKPYDGSYSECYKDSAVEESYLEYLRYRKERLSIPQEEAFEVYEKDILLIDELD